MGNTVEQTPAARLLAQVDDVMERHQADSRMTRNGPRENCIYCAVSIGSLEPHPCDAYRQAAQMRALVEGLSAIANDAPPGALTGGQLRFIAGRILNDAAAMMSGDADVTS